jgi:two-component system NtrC family sensor kinase
MQLHTDVPWIGRARSRVASARRSKEVVDPALAMLTLVPSVLEVIVDRITVGVFVVDLEMRIVVWNDFLAIHSGRPAKELLGRDLFESFPELNRKWLGRKIRHVANLGNMAFTSWQQRPYLLKLAHHRHIKDGPDAMRQDCTFVPLLGTDGKCAFVCVIVVDVTDTSISQENLSRANRELEQTLRDLATAQEAARLREVELRHSQKLEAVGRLAAGVAHEINTPIQFIGDSCHFLGTVLESYQAMLANYRELRDAVARTAGHEELLLRVRECEEREDADYIAEQAPRAIQRTLEGVERVAKIVRALKEFAHPDAPGQMAADLNRAIESTIVVATNELKYIADVEVEFGALPAVVCHLNDMNQVFLNLLVNAAHAIADRADGERGRIVVRTHLEGDAAVVSISDTGMGIPEEIRSRIFDPFFTTKEVGRGSGQGLAIARNIVVDKHGGRLTFETEIGRGTTFFVHLPVAGRKGAEAAA